MPSTPETPRPGGSSNTTADRALQILLLFSDHRRTITAALAAEALSVSRSSAYRYLQSLVKAEFLAENDPSGFALGPRIVDLARIATRRDLTELAMPAMRELRDHVGETVLLMRLTGTRIVCIERIETQHRVRISYERGSSFPLNAGASALILLAWRDEHEVRALLSRDALPAYTTRSITNPTDQLARMTEVRRSGYATTFSELDEGVVGVAAPVFDRAGTAIASMGVAGLESRLRHRLNETIEATVASADALTAILHS